MRTFDRSSQKLLIVPKYGLKSKGNRAFSVSWSYAMLLFAFYPSGHPLRYLLLNHLLKHTFFLRLLLNLKILFVLFLFVSDVLAVQHLGQHLLLLRCYINKLDLDLDLEHTS